MAEHGTGEGRTWVRAHRSGARQGRQRAFIVFWLAALVLGAWRIWQGETDFARASTVPLLLLMLACTVALLRWLPGPAAPPRPAPLPGRARFVLFLLGAGLALILLYNLLGRGLLLAFPIAGLATLALLRGAVKREELIYALVLGLVAALAGLGFGPRFAGVYPINWGLLQVPLVLFCLPAGWALLRRTGLLEQGLGRSVLLARGWRPALATFGGGALLGLPWAVFNVALGAGRQDAWLSDWWQAFAAFQPAIAEEAWARVFLVALLLMPLRRVASDRLALAGAVAIAGYWFAYLHSPTGLSGLPSALLTGTLFSLPLSYIWLRRGFEAAVGFHFLVDFLRFGTAYLLNAGLWSGG